MVGYSAMHYRVRAARGKPSEYQCWRCLERGVEKQAEDWATIHTEDGEDVWADYVPLCTKCHMGYDLTRNKAGSCPAGHEYTENNIYWNKGYQQCKRCTKDRANARYAARRSSSPPAS